jgi:hypothetical protein
VNNLTQITFWQKKLFQEYTFTNKISIPHIIKDLVKNLNFRNVMYLESEIIEKIGNAKFNEIQTQIFALSHSGPKF